MALRRFSDNPAATTPLDGTETIPALQGGVDVRVTVSDIVDAASGAVTSVNGATGAVVLELGDLDDVDVSGASDGDVLTWASDDNEWQAKPAGGGSGTVESIVAGFGINVDDTDPANPVVSATGGGGSLGWFNVKGYGALGDGTTDDTVAIQDAIDAAESAGGGIVYFPAGIYVVNGALQDTGAANAQIVLPSIDVLSGNQITIALLGEFPPTPDISVIGNIPVSESGSIIKSTLTSGSGGNCIGIKGPTGSAGDFSNVLISLRNLTIRMPANPTHSAVDLRYAACAEQDNVVIDAGSYYVQGISEPTTSGSYALRMPRQNNGALSRLGTINIVGFYNGLEVGEHANGFACQAAWGCKRAFIFNNGPYHASHFQRLMGVHCEQVIVAGGTHYLQVEQLNVEHATSGWWATDYDVNDASNQLVGYVNWHAVLAGSGVSNTFTVNGANRLTIRQIGAADDAIAGLIAEPSDKDYRLVVKAPHRGRIVETTTVCASGSCTATFKINTTALGGTANSVTTSEQSQSHSSSNTFAAGDDLVVTISANSTCLDLSFCIRYQRL